MRIRDPELLWSGIRDGKLRIRDKHPGSATLFGLFGSISSLNKVLTKGKGKHNNFLMFFCDLDQNSHWFRSWDPWTFWKQCGSEIPAPVPADSICVFLVSHKSHRIFKTAVFQFRNNYSLLIPFFRSTQSLGSKGSVTNLNPFSPALTGLIFLQFI